MATFDPLEANVPLAPLAGAVNAIEVPPSAPVSGQPLLFASAT
jgi:hypothetical protein